jgi:hypothetical protein
MADVVVNIEVSNVRYSTWLRTSYIASSEVSENGTPMIERFELGPDQEDAFNNFMDEATREVSKLFSSRQGDAAGMPFEYDGTNVIYRFNENEPVLKQAEVLKNELGEDVKNAIFSYVSILWYNAKAKKEIEAYYREKFETHSISIEKNLYLLHD